MAKKRLDIDHQDSPKMKQEKGVEDVPPLSVLDGDEQNEFVKEIFDAMPQGCGLMPTKQEPMIKGFLNKMVSNSNMPLNWIQDTFHPLQLTSIYKFFTPRSAGKPEYRKDVDKTDANGLKVRKVSIDYNKKTSKEDGDNFSMQKSDKVPNKKTIQNIDDPNLHHTACLFMQNVRVSNSNTNQCSYGVDFDILDNLDGRDDGAEFDTMVSNPLSVYEPNFHCWGNGCVYSEQVSNQETVQAPDQYPIFQAMSRDSLPMQNPQEQYPNSPDGWFSCFCFAYVSAYDYLGSELYD